MEHHPFAPVADPRSRVLILGSFPSITSTAEGFYYTHPRNQFWPILATLFAVSLPPDNDARRAFALQHGIALWDVYAALERKAGNSSDASLAALQPNDLTGFLQAHPRIAQVFCTGGKAYEGYRKHGPEGSLPVTRLPSTSPAYAAMGFDAKRDAYRVIRAVLDA